MRGGSSRAGRTRPAHVSPCCAPASVPTSPRWHWLSSARDKGLHASCPSDSPALSPTLCLRQAIQLELQARRSFLRKWSQGDGGGLRAREHKTSDQISGHSPRGSQSPGGKAKGRVDKERQESLWDKASPHTGWISPSSPVLLLQWV